MVEHGTENPGVPSSILGPGILFLYPLDNSSYKFYINSVKKILYVFTIFLIYSISCTEYTPQGAWIQVGYASYYSREFAGRKTSSGEIFDPMKLTAAHRRLPFGTLVRVTNLDNGRSVIVKINDRGPFVKGRIIDLSYKAALKIGMLSKGVAKVKLEVIRWPKQRRQ